MSIEGKVAVVTGGGAGIGKAIAATLAEAGANIGLLDIQEASLNKTVLELQERGFKASKYVADVANADQVDLAFKGVVRDFGGVDILVNNAGIGHTGAVVGLSEEVWDRVIDVNLKGAFLCARAAAKEMLSRGASGRIINIVSTAAENARVESAPYSASKAGLVQFTKVLALELGEQGITVNAVGPGLAFVDSLEAHPQSPEYHAAFLKEVPLARAASPRDIALAVLFLVSPDAEYINGQVLYVDGGYSAGKFSVKG